MLKSAETVLKSFEDAGYARIEPGILHPADIFLDLSGEEIRHRLFVTSDSEGRELALRPEYTIPVARAYLASKDSGKVKTYSYCGPIFRVRQGETDEFIQAGIESFGRTDAEAADAEILARAVAAVKVAGVKEMEIRVGDTGLFNVLLDALGLHPVWQRRLRRAFAKGTLDKAALQSLAAVELETSDHAGLLNALSGQDPLAARGFVEDLLKIAGISSVGGRSPAEIAERFLAQASNTSEGTLPDEALDALTRYVAIEGDPDRAVAQLRKLAKETKLDLDRALDSFETRTGFIAASGVDVKKLAFSARFGRNLDYYTGGVFEIRRKGDKTGRPIVGGGRYDRLLQILGAKKAVPAVGCAVFIDRIAGGVA